MYRGVLQQNAHCRAVAPPHSQAILKNVQACNELSELTRTSLGPNGMNKMVINHLEKLFVTSDAATIASELEVQHPAAKMLCLAAKMQQTEMGDATNFVITFAGAMLNEAESLLRMGLHVSEVIAGYMRSTQFVLDTLAELCCDSVKDPRDAKDLARALTGTLAAKQYGFEAALSKFAAEGAIQVMPDAPKKPSVNVDSVRTVKIIGGGFEDSLLVRGIMVNRTTAGTIKRVENAKVAVFGTSIEAAATEAKGTVLITNAEELLNYSKSEEKAMDDMIRGIKESGANVVISGGSISEMAMHYLERYELMAIKIVSKFELRRLCRAVGATACVRVGPVSPDEMGSCALVEVREIGGRHVTVFDQKDFADDSKIATVVLRSSTQNTLDDFERALDDGVNAAKVLAKDGRLLPGAGATEIELALRLQGLAETCSGLQQYSINAFAEALEVIPRTLAENAGKKPSQVISELYAAHKRGEGCVGVDVDAPIDTPTVRDMTKDDNIFDVYLTKYEALRLATDAALTVLRVDQIIMAKRAGGPKPRGDNPNWDQD